jgi:transposase
MVAMEGLMDILALDRQGYSVRAIARKLGIHRKTVRKYLEAGGPPVYRKEKRKETILDAYRPAIRDWLAQDSFQATWIYDRLRPLGYTGSYDTVREYVREVTPCGWAPWPWSPVRSAAANPLHSGGPPAACTLPSTSSSG